MVLVFVQECMIYSGAVWLPVALNQTKYDLALYFERIRRLKSHLEILF